MSSPSDPRPDTRKYVIAERLQVIPFVLLAASVFVGLIVGDSDQGAWSNVFLGVDIFLVVSIVVGFVVIRLKQNADARWALRDSDRIDRLKSKANRK